MAELDVHPDVSRYLGIKPITVTTSTAEVSYDACRVARKYVALPSGLVRPRQDHGTRGNVRGSMGEWRDVETERLQNLRDSNLLTDIEEGVEIGLQPDEAPPLPAYMVSDTDAKVQVNWSAIPKINATTVGELVPSKSVSV